MYMWFLTFFFFFDLSGGKEPHLGDPGQRVMGTSGITCWWHVELPILPRLRSRSLIALRALCTLQLTINLYYHFCFRVACAIHDLCYVTPGQDKDTCNGHFWDNMLMTCTMPGLASVAYWYVTCTPNNYGYHYWEWRSRSELAVTGFPFSNKSKIFKWKFEFITIKKICFRWEANNIFSHSEWYCHSSSF